MSLSDATRSFRQPEYTGENRCTPCTVVNVGIAAVLAGVLAAANPLLGVVAFAGSIAVIYLRGYLVPGTPALTKQYLPASALRLFGKEPVEPERTVRADATERDGAVDLLYAADVLAGEGATADLDDGFRRAWRARIDERSESSIGPDAVAALFDAEEAEAQSERSFVVDGSKMVRWESEGALIADLAADAELRERIEGWETLDRSLRMDVVTALRLFLDACPDCGATVETTVETDDRCCQKPFTAFDAACRDCGAPLATATVTGIDDEDRRPPALRFLGS
jgi:hypothetical protein